MNMSKYKHMLLINVTYAHEVFRLITGKMFIWIHVEKDCLIRNQLNYGQLRKCKTTFVPMSIQQSVENHPTSRPSRRIWGDYTTEDIHKRIDAIYDEIVVWRRNIFMLPSGAIGKCQ